MSAKQRHTVLVMSGKGGVGKSTVLASLATLALEQGQKVGILDIDLCGPSQPRVFGLEGQSILQAESGWLPVETNNLYMISLAFLITNKDDPVIWRGPKKTATINSFLQDVCWPADLDLLLIDTPPGTSDEHISVVEALLRQQAEKESQAATVLDGAIIVSTPQQVSLSDVRKEIVFCKKMGLPIIGLVENMAGFRCPSCSECSYVFASGGGKALASELDVAFLGSLPIDPQLTSLADSGRIREWSTDQKDTPLHQVLAKLK